jgi:integrase
VRVKGEGLKWIPVAKSKAGLRTLPLPRFAIDMLTARQQVPYFGEQPMIFGSTAGTWRDPNNFAKQWRTAREDLGVPDVTTHSVRKTVADLIDAEGLSARVGADQLGHSHVSMTQDKVHDQGRSHTEVDDLLDRAVINAE